MQDTEITVTAWQPLATRLIQQFEGCAKKRADGKFEAYPDPRTHAAPWTIGWGSTGPDITQGTVWTQAQCDARFEEHLAQFGREVTSLLSTAPTSAYQMAGLVSFAYNLGTGNLAKSALLYKHRAGNYAGAQAEFARWNKSKGVAMPGLTRRRAAEAALYGRAG